MGDAMQESCTAFCRTLDHECETELCTFNTVNGVCLAVIGVVGFILSSSVVVLLGSGIVKLPGTKSIFILNVAANDMALAILALLRGLDFVTELVHPVDREGRASTFCQVYHMVSSLFKNNLLWVLVPLTVDRFIAVLLPTRYPALVTRKTSILMITAPWVILVAIMLYDVIAHLLGKLELQYTRVQHRCTYSEERQKIEPILLLLLPILIICTLYTVMLVKIIRNKIKSGRFFISTTAIILTGILSTFPEIIIKSFCIRVSYEVLMVLTVTLFYINSICNPIIYLGSHRKFQKRIIEDKRPTAIKITSQH